MIPLLPLRNRIQELLAEATLDGKPIGGQEPQVPAPEPKGEPAPEPKGEPKAFHEWTSPGGEKTVFASPEELTEAMNKSFFMQKDYSEKTAAHAKDVEKIKGREQELEKLSKDLTEVGGQYKKFKDFMDVRPQVYEQFRRQVESPPSPEEAYKRSQGYTDTTMEGLKKELQEMREWRDEFEFGRQKTGIYDKMKSKFTDFDSDAVEGLLDSLGKNDPETLIKTAYYALKGQADPLEMERRATEAAKAKQQAAGIVGGVSAPVSKDAPKDLIEARKIGLARARE